MVPVLSIHNRITYPAVMIAIMAVTLFFLPFTSTAAEPQQGFPSPQDAAQALVGACEKNDVNQLSLLFGPQGRELVMSGDDTADREGRARFAAAAKELIRFTTGPKGKVFLHVGKDDWSFPIPLIKKNDLWYFDTKEGKEELINRRIGRNEIAAQLTMRAFVDGQKDYYSKDRDGDGILEYAQKFSSSPGRKDGLFWPAQEGEEESPLGPLAAKATKEGYAKKKSKAGATNPEPYHGYLFKILAVQGKNASGGAKRYVVKGNMTGGFAFLAYPAQYGVSGIMTFIINHDDGTIYEKDLGKKTESIAASVTKFNPDKSWKKVDEGNALKK